MPRLGYTDAILSCLPRDARLTFGTLKWHVAEELLTLPEPESGLPLREYDLPGSFRACFSRCLHQLADKEEIELFEHPFMPEEKDLPEIYACQSNNRIVRLARAEMLPQLLAAHLEPEPFNSQQEKAPIPGRDRYEQYFAQGFINPEKLRSSGEVQAITFVRQSAGNVLDLLFKCDLAKLDKTFKQPREDRCAFAAALLKLDEWSSARWSAPESGLLKSATFVRDAVLEVPQRKKHEALLQELSALIQCMDNLVRLGLPTLRLKDKIQSWSSTTGRSAFKLSDELLVYLEDNYPDECIRYSRYSQRTPNWVPLSREESGLRARPSRPTLPDDHPFRRLVSQYIYRSQRWVSRRDA